MLQLDQHCSESKKKRLRSYEVRWWPWSLGGMESMTGKADKTSRIDSRENVQKTHGFLLHVLYCIGFRTRFSLKSKSLGETEHGKMQDWIYKDMTWYDQPKLEVPQPKCPAEMRKCSFRRDSRGGGVFHSVAWCNAREWPVPRTGKLRWKWEPLF
jgi:hypothetical protein